jgi:MtN3 and saliva related transmembrane protein
MHFEIIEPKVSPTMNGFLILANIINLLYNIPQIVQTYKTKSTKDFNIWFIVLRIIGNFIWLVYALEVNSLLMLINYSVTVISSLFIGYYKWREYLETKMKFTYNDQLLLDDKLSEDDKLSQDKHLIENDTDFLVIKEDNI